MYILNSAKLADSQNRNCMGCDLQGIAYILCMMFSGKWEEEERVVDICNLIVELLFVC